MSVSAYSFDDSTKAFTNVRMNINEVRPLINIDDEGEVIPSNAVRMKEKDYSEIDNQFLKLNYSIYKWVFENIDNPKIVSNAKDLNIESFALQLHDMHEDLGENLSGFSVIKGWY